MEKHENPPPYFTEPSTSSIPPSIIIVQSVPTQRGPTTDTVIVVPVTQFGPKSQTVVCPHCQSEVLTKVEAETSTKTHNASVIMCVLLLWPCAWMPYYIDSCKSKNHYCSNCGAYLGSCDS